MSLVTITGIVKSIAGHARSPLPHVDILILDTDRNRLGKTQSDNTGRFSIQVDIEPDDNHQTVFLVLYQASGFQGTYRFGQTKAANKDVGEVDMITW